MLRLHDRQLVDQVAFPVPHGRPASIDDPIPKTVTLLTLLRFYAETYVRLVKDLHDLETSLRFPEAEAHAEGKTTAPPLSVEDRETAIVTLQHTKTACKDIGLLLCTKHAETLLLEAKNGYLTADATRALHENIERELGCHYFVGIPAAQITAYTSSLTGWEDIAQAFPEATDDIEEMNKCWALSRYSAAVFHSLLVAEHGLVKLGQRLGVTDPKEGWDASCKKLESLVKAGHAANTSGINFESLHQLNTCAQSMKLAWRNKVNHATGKPLVLHGGFASYAAEEILMATRGFMRRLMEIV